MLYKSKTDRQPTALLDFFREAEDELVDVIQQIEIFQNSNTGKPVPNSLTRRLKRAKDQYENDAQGAKVEAYLRRHKELQQKLGGDLFTELRLQYDAYRNQTYRFNEVYLTPQYDTILANRNRGWSEITISSESLEQRTQNSRTTFSAGLSGGYGLWWAGGSYSQDTEREYFQSETTSLTIKMEIMRVIIRYPWMNYDLFGARNWKWGRTSIYYPNTVISDGIYNPSPSADELAPLIPTSMIVARNVSIDSNLSSEIREAFKKQVKAKGSFGWGPFTLAGFSYNNSESSEYIKTDDIGNHMEAEDPQVFGYVGNLVPKSPNPDTSLPWKVVSTSPVINMANTMISSLLKSYKIEGIRFSFTDVDDDD